MVKTSQQAITEVFGSYGPNSTTGKAQLYTFKCYLTDFKFERTIKVIDSNLTDAWCQVGTQLHRIGGHTPTHIELVSEEDILDAAS